MSTSTLSAGAVVDGTYTIDQKVRERSGAVTYRAKGPAGEVHLTAYGPDC